MNLIKSITSIFSKNNPFNISQRVIDILPTLGKYQFPIDAYCIDKFKELPSRIDIDMLIDSDALMEDLKSTVVYNKLTYENKRFKNWATFQLEPGIFIDPVGNHIFSKVKNIQSKKISKHRQCTKYFLFYIPSKLEEAKKWVEVLTKYEVEEVLEKESNIYMIVRPDGLFDLEPFKINPPKIPSIALFYGQDFKELYITWIKKLRKKGTHGISLLSGEKGTGKTTLIRWILPRINKKVIYMPANMTHALTDPDFLQFLKEHKDSVLFIEDAENVLRSRDLDMSNLAISNILNLSDGMLADELNIQLIATYNTSESTLDDALFRKGRLLMKHHFGLLPKENAQEISNSLGYTHTITEDMRLADIFNQDEETYEMTKPAQIVGFKVSNKV